MLCNKAILAAIKHSNALPKILNTDQGSQCTYTEWTEELKRLGITISMDGKGRWRDNVYIERFWRTIQYQCIFLNEYSTLPAMENGLKIWIKRYNTWRPHQALDNKTPEQVYQEGLFKVVLGENCTPSNLYHRAPQLLRSSALGSRGLCTTLRNSCDNGTWSRGSQKLLAPAPILS